MASKLKTVSLRPWGVEIDTTNKGGSADQRSIVRPDINQNPALTVPPERLPQTRPSRASSILKKILLK